MDWKKIVNWASSSVALIILCLMIGGFAWPISNHLVAYFWWSIGGFVGLWEIGLKIFTGKTLTQHIRSSEKLNPASYWLTTVTWLVFGFILFVHFTKPTWMVF